MKKNIYFCKNFGIIYTFISVLTTISQKLFPNSFLFHKLHYFKYRLVVKYLYKNNEETINKYKNKDTKNSGGSHLIFDSKYIWICWWQGYDNAPQLVKACINNIKKHSSGKKVIIIDQYNYSNYVEINKSIVDKINESKFPITFFADILRMNLLSKYGGVWIDSTVFLNEDVSEINKYELFTVKHDLYSSWHVCKGKWSSFFLGAGKNNLGIKLINEILINYAISENYLIAYLLLDAVITIAYENIASFKKQIDAIPVNNKKIFCMEELLNTPAENFTIPSKINKLSYKRKYVNKINGLNTVYYSLINDRL